MSRSPLKALGLQNLERAFCLALVLLFAGGSVADARDLSARPITDLYVFGDSLSDSGNLFALTGNEPESPPYFEGRFSDGPVWFERLAAMLELDIDFNVSVLDDPLANDQAFGGAQSGFGSLSGNSIGVLSQVENFTAAGGSFGRDDLIVIWVGANDYFSVVNANPLVVVGNIMTAVRRLSRIGARRFFIVNLPNLGDTPLGISTKTQDVLNFATKAHNDLLKAKVAGLRLFSRREFALFDVNATFKQVVANPEAFGFENVTTPCLLPRLDGSTRPSGLCPPQGDSFESNGVLFWDLVHPAKGGHRNIAIAAHSSLIALQERAQSSAVALADD